VLRAGAQPCAEPRANDQPRTYDWAVLVGPVADHLGV
jgi:hypothetical protein